MHSKPFRPCKVYMIKSMSYIDYEPGCSIFNMYVIYMFVALIMGEGHETGA